MREILFRGKREDNGERVMGMPCATFGSGIYSIQTLQGGIFDIIPETLGQYIGLTDKNGNRIFEGDIVSFTRVNALGYTTSRVGDVRYYDELPIFYIMATTGDAWDWCYCDNIEVIGNIHDNPELLKGGDE